MPETLFMTRWDFLDAMAAWTEKLYKGILLPKNADPEGLTEEDEEAVFREDGSSMTGLKVYRMRLPDFDSVTAPAPYCLHQIVTGEDGYDENGRDVSTVLLRSVFCIFHPLAEDLSLRYDPGAERAMEIAERFRIAVLREGMIQNRFVLNLQAGKVETLYYPDDMRPYYITEVASNWDIPAVKREFRQYLGV